MTWEVSTARTEYATASEITILGIGTAVIIFLYNISNGDKIS
jgi:hypothetical protein